MKNVLSLFKLILFILICIGNSNLFSMKRERAPHPGQQILDSRKRRAIDFNLLKAQQEKENKEQEEKLRKIEEKKRKIEEKEKQNKQAAENKINEICATIISSFEILENTSKLENILDEINKIIPIVKNLFEDKNVQEQLTKYNDISKLWSQLANNIQELVTTISDKNKHLKVDVCDQQVKILHDLLNELLKLFHLPEIPLEIEMDITNDEILAHQEQEKADIEFAEQIANGEQPQNNQQFDEEEQLALAIQLSLQEQQDQEQTQNNEFQLAELFSTAWNALKGLFY